MRRKSRTEGLCLAARLLLVLGLASCNLPTPGEPATSTPEALSTTVIVTMPQPTQTAQVETAQPTETRVVGEPTLPTGDDVYASVSVKDGDVSFQGKITFPGSDSSDEISIKPVGFDNAVAAGSLVFKLTCAGEKEAKVNYKGGAVKSGLPGCGETWTVAVVSGSADNQITIRLDDSGEVDWTLSVTAGN